MALSSETDINALSLERRKHSSVQNPETLNCWQGTHAFFLLVLSMISEEPHELGSYCSLTAFCETESDQSVN